MDRGPAIRRDFCLEAKRNVIEKPDCGYRKPERGVGDFAQSSACSRVAMRRARVASLVGRDSVEPGAVAKPEIGNRMPKRSATKTRSLKSARCSGASVKRLIVGTAEARVRCVGSESPDSGLFALVSRPPKGASQKRHYINLISRQRAAS